MASLKIDISAPGALWRGRQGLCRNALTAAAKAESTTGSVSLLLGDDAAIAALNRAWRGAEGPTNVLSFPAVEAARAQGALGDIALAFETIAAEAAAQSKSFEAHAAHLLVHGFLHLLGYDHSEAAEADRMEARERAILARLGIADPYAERVTP